MQRLVLASSSAYRKSLLERLGTAYTAHAPDIDEQPLNGESPAAMVRRLSEAKARAISKDYPNSLIIGSDQVAVNGATVLTKPGKFDNAFAQLKGQSGNRVTFLTGLALLNTNSGHCAVDIVTTEVDFKTLSDGEIRSYLERDEPYACAGSFRSEGLGIALFDAVHTSDPTALIGLPLIRLCKMLRDENYNIL